ncbi:unnamed protein product [Adineta steineri]|uniref:Neurotransmitter-gated ion-channel ligand-binding domain-containing protein n=1 Tax=Adineta steineri TaxID=433720 RepID=A0A813TDH8_9BILA|nr:unnamed protein product [Adineta steineri]CAF3607940.1 unnamed protein product [Adineta steineri]
MRLKTLRKERPAFENEGVFVNGSRMDLPHTEAKSLKYRSNNRLTSLTFSNNVLLSHHPSLYDHTYEMNTHFIQQTPIHQKVRLSSPSETSHLSSYQTIEANYLEHGIRINLNPTTTTIKRHNQTSENLNERNSARNTQRHKSLNNGQLSRPSTPLHCLTNVQHMNEYVRPSSSLQRTTSIDRERIYAQHQSSNNSCLSTTVVSEHYDQKILPKPSLATLIGNDPDLAYMSSLLQRTGGASSRETVKNRPVLRVPPVIQRHRQIITKTNSNQPDISSSINSYTNSLVRHATIATIPQPTSSSKKIEKDIVKHASRIRTNNSQNFSKSHTHENRSLNSNSLTRLNYMNKQNQMLKSSKSISMEPLKLLLEPTFRSTPSPPPSHTTSISSNDYLATQKNNKKRSILHTSSFIDHNNNYVHDGVTGFIPNEHLKSSLLNYENLSRMKTIPSDMITNYKTPQSNSFDSGCYDRSSNYSGDTHSITLSIQQALSSVPSTRYTSVATSAERPGSASLVRYGTRQRLQHSTTRRVHVVENLNNLVSVDSKRNSLSTLTAAFIEANKQANENNQNQSNTHQDLPPSPSLKHLIFKKVHPDPIKVNIRCVFLRVGEIDTLNERFYAELLLEASWEEKSFKGLQTRSFDPSVNWTPELELMNGIGELDHDITYSVHYDKQGLATITEHHRLKGTLWERMELHHFPVDVQELSLSITTSHSIKEMIFTKNIKQPSGVNRRIFTDEQEWYLFEHVDIKVTEQIDEYLDDQHNHSVVICSSHVARKYGYFIWNAYFLIFLITSASFTTFPIPLTNIHGRVQIACTLLLTSITFRWLCYKALPTISYLTAVDVYAIGSIFSLCLLNIYHGVIGYINYRMSGNISGSTTSSEYVLTVDRWALVVFTICFCAYQIGTLIWTYLVPLKKRRIMFVKDNNNRFQIESTYNGKINFVNIVQRTEGNKLN